MSKQTLTITHRSGLVEHFDLNSIRTLTLNEEITIDGITRLVPRKLFDGLIQTNHPCPKEVDRSYVEHQHEWDFLPKQSSQEKD